eukprot:jgi/Ulvmu1/5355/UM022_0149.1
MSARPPARARTALTMIQTRATSPKFWTSNSSAARRRRPGEPGSQLLGSDMKPSSDMAFVNSGLLQQWHLARARIARLAHRSIDSKCRAIIWLIYCPGSISNEHVHRGAGVLSFGKQQAMVHSTQLRYRCYAQTQALHNPDRNVCSSVSTDANAVCKLELRGRHACLQCGHKPRLQLPVACTPHPALHAHVSRQSQQINSGPTDAGVGKHRCIR